MEVAAFSSLMTSLVRDDDSRLSPGDVSSAIGLVINRYNSDRPLELTEDLAVGADLVIATPSAWVNRRSRIITIEGPIGNNPPSFVTEDFYYVYDLPNSAIELRLLTGVVPAGQLVRVRYTAAHASALSFEEDDLEALAYLGAAILCDQLAALYSHDTDTSVAADSVQHNDKGRQFANRARDYRVRYESKFGKPSTSDGASTVVQYARTGSTGHTRMFSR